MAHQDARKIRGKAWGEAIGLILDTFRLARSTANSCFTKAWGYKKHKALFIAQLFKRSSKRSWRCNARDACRTIDFYCNKRFKRSHWESWIFIFYSCETSCKSLDICPMPTGGHTVQKIYPLQRTSYFFRRPSHRRVDNRPSNIQTVAKQRCNQFLVWTKQAQRRCTGNPKQTAEMFASIETMRGGDCQYIEALQIPDADKKIYLENVVGGQVPSNVHDQLIAQHYLQKIRCNYTPMLMKNSTN